MPKRKAHIVRRANNLPTNRGVQTAQRQDTVAESDGPATSSSLRRSSSSGSDSIASSSAITLERYDELYPEYIQTELPGVSPSPNNIAGSLCSLTLEVQSEGEIVLEDPPNDTENCNPADNWNFRSLAEPQEDEALDLPPPATAKDPDDDEDVAEEKLMAGTLNLMIETNKQLMDASMMAAAAFCWGTWAARQVCKWIRTFQHDNKLPTNLYGTWNGSIMEDDNLSAAIQQWLRGLDQGIYIQASDVVNFFRTEAAEQFASLIDGPLLLCTTQ
ncbi:unnamed protein product [Rhizoctonia solani]|uniref:Uncharacterized protein n=1 Tax=Rhizoctonia solani TaxID=456999 RepID=A0A8H3BEL5_9AGAM|nr:unnamed protein product [Rhizoctonia solani]